MELLKRIGLACVIGATAATALWFADLQSLELEYYSHDDQFLGSEEIPVRAKLRIATLFATFVALVAYVILHMRRHGRQEHH
jgi:hypothetical protein